MANATLVGIVGNRYYIDIAYYYIGITLRALNFIE